jgi:prevent-host-death family protein
VAIPPREAERLASQHDIEEVIPGLYVQTNVLLYHPDLGLLFDGDSAPRAAGLSVQEVAANMTTSYGHIASDMNINAAEFKAKCLKLIDEVAATHQPLVITKRGKPLAKLVPIEDETGADLFGYMKGTLTIADDIVQPIPEPWSAESGDEDDLYTDLTPGGQSR